MAYTKYGEFMRILRIKYHEVMSDTADILGVKTPFVSAVENGKKNVPEEWIPKLIEHYHLSENELKELMNAIEASKTQIRIPLTSASNSQRTLAIQFQRSFEKLDDTTANAIMKLLNKEEEES